MNGLPGNGGGLIGNGRSSLARGRSDLRALPPPGAHQIKENQGGDSAAGIAEHVLLGVPYIALGAEKIIRVIPAHNDRILPFNDFIRRGYSHHEKEAENPRQHFPRILLAHQILRYGKRIKPHRKMGHPVKRVPVGSHQLPEPLERHFRKRVMRPTVWQASQKNISV